VKLWDRRSKGVAAVAAVRLGVPATTLQWADQQGQLLCAGEEEGGASSCHASGTVHVTYATSLACARAGEWRGGAAGRAESVAASLSGGQ
jgi:hypothetical protein